MSLSFLAPAGRFEVVRREGKTWIDPRSHARYDRVTAVLDSIDVEALGRVYPRLSPMLEAAYREIGAPGTTFEGTLTRAIERLVSTPVPAEPLEVVEEESALWSYADPELEALTAAQKHLVRMGPANQRRIQEKLKTVAGALGLTLLAEAGEARPAATGR